MANRLTKIYTRTGDAGDTGRADGTRVSKDDASIHAQGDIDELNSLIGLLAAKTDDPDVAALRQLEKAPDVGDHLVEFAAPTDLGVDLGCDGVDAEPGRGQADQQLSRPR